MRFPERCAMRPNVPIKGATARKSWKSIVVIIRLKERRGGGEGQMVVNLFM
jgi:hypothetical protein